VLGTVASFGGGWVLASLDLTAVLEGVKIGSPSPSLRLEHIRSKDQINRNIRIGLETLKTQGVYMARIGGYVNLQH
jgi:hypothetical protein